MPEFVDALLRAWERTYLDLMEELLAMEPLAMLGNILALVDRWPLQAEAALRAWGWGNPAVAEAVRRHDLAQESANRRWLERVITDPDRRRLLAHMCSAMVVGMQSLQRTFDLELTLAVSVEFARAVLGIELLPAAGQVRLLDEPAPMRRPTVALRAQPAKATPVDPPPDSRPARRVDRGGYFDAAIKILGSSGYHGLNVENLCAELGVTKGSFYHHFAGMPQFVDALLEAWENSVAELLRGWLSHDPVTGLAIVLSDLDRYPLQADAALRAWGWSNPPVAAAVRRWDLARESGSRTWLAQLGHDPERSRVLAHLLQATVVGMAILQRPVDVDLTRAVCIELTQAILN
jgi:AcrR family transcriptional regulator